MVVSPAVQTVSKLDAGGFCTPGGARQLAPPHSTTDRDVRTCQAAQERPHRRTYENAAVAGMGQFMKEGQRGLAQRDDHPWERVTLRHAAWDQVSHGSGRDLSA